MSLYENALHSIQIGVEDFAAADPRRLLSAIRNIHAGILLLCKEKLRRFPNGESLLKQRLEPALGPHGILTLKGVGNKTVDLQGIKERFASLGIPFNWADLDRVTKIRNDMEHMFYSGARR